MNPEDEQHFASHVSQVYKQHVAMLADDYQRRTMVRINEVVKRGGDFVRFGRRGGLMYRKWFDFDCTCLCCIPCLMPKIPLAVLMELDRRFRAMGFHVDRDYRNKYITITWV